MMTYFIHNNETQADSIYIPDGECFLQVDADRMKEFISETPRFVNATAEICRIVPPEEFGGVIALRDESGNVRVLNPELWYQRLIAHLGPEADEYQKETSS